MDAGPRKLERTVKPRKTSPARLPVIAYSPEEGIYTERLDHLSPVDHLIPVLLTEPSSIFVCHNAVVICQQLDERYFGERDDWQFKLKKLEREVWRPNRERKTAYAGTVVNFFGFSTGTKEGTRPHKPKSRYFYPLDPTVFFDRKTVFDLRPGSRESELEGLIRWGIQVRDWAYRNGLKVTSTSGGLAAQLLKDSRFYPTPRRKVPQATNKWGREALPGNFYKLYSSSDVDGISVGYREAVYLDQRNAHHYAASQVEFPSSDTLMARGHFRQLVGALEGGPVPKAWLRRGGRSFDRFRSTHKGLIYCQIRCPEFKRPSFHLPCMEKPGLHDTFLFTNEVSYLESFRGACIEHIYAGWTSPHLDTGLNRYAEWAINEIRESESDPYRKEWLKPVLLATYGILAARPQHIEFGYKKAKSGKNKRYPVASGMIDVVAMRTSKEVEAAIANTIHRGMIEAETRIQSLGLARWLHSKGCRVISVYADSVFIEGHGEDLPPNIPEPWRVQERLSNLRIETATHFRSDQLTKTPGIPKSRR